MGFGAAGSSLRAGPGTMLETLNGALLNWLQSCVNTLGHGWLGRKTRHDKDPSLHPWGSAR
jgi:hypothetical protein